MVIGDSLAQGCRSMTVNATYCAQSWGARVARAQGWEFVTPDFPRPVLFDLEQEIRRIDTLGVTLEGLRFHGFVDRLLGNLRDWLVNARESAFDCFDNLAVSGAAVYDLYTRTAATSAAEVAALTPNGASALLPLSAYGDLHIAINGRFTLNPSQDPAFDGFTMLDWVRAREPETLLVQIGHNHGLYTIGSEAKDVSFTQGDAAHGDYFAQWGRLAAELAALPATVTAILVVLLPKVGGVANLRPRGVERPGGYAPTYEAEFSGSPAVLPGARLAEIDAAVRAANDTIRQTVLSAAGAAGARLKFLDAYALFDALDYKNSLEPARRIAVAGGLAVDNRYLDGALQVPPPFGPGGLRLAAGGFQSIDGMHPSGCGYGVLACEAMTALGLPFDRGDVLAPAYADDTLLAHYPGELNVVTRLLGAIRDLVRFNQFVPAPRTFLDADDRMHLLDALRLMRGVFNPP